MTKLTFQMRPADPADADAIRTFTRAAYARWVPIVGREPLPMTADYSAAVRDHRFDLMLVDGRLAGLIETQAHADHLYVVNVAVRPDLQGGGLGARLMAHAEGIARVLGLPEMRLVTNQRMAANIALYRRLGYAVTGEGPFNGGVRVDMAKTLAQPPRRLLFLPGAGGDPNFWKPLGERLPSAWRKTWFSWPGLGAQRDSPDIAGWEDLVGLVEAELDDVPVDLLAQSMGGWVAMQVLLRHPDKVRRVVLSVTSAGVDMAALGAADWRADYRRTNPDAAGWITGPVPNLADRLHDVRQPTLLLWENSDPISPLAVGERLLSLLPNADLHVSPGDDHAHVVTRAEALAPLVAAHLG